MKSDFFSKNFFKTWLEQANPKFQDWFKEEIDYLKENIEPNSKVLDVGCGFGRHIKILADFSEEVYGVDNNPDVIKKAQDNLSEFDNVNLITRDAQSLDVQGNYFDYVICMTNTFGDFPEYKPEVLKEMMRVCKEEGKIIVSVYNDKALDLRKKDYKKIGLHINKIEDGIIYTDEGLVSEQFSKSELQKLFNKVRLQGEILELNPISFLCELEK